MIGDDSLQIWDDSSFATPLKQWTNSFISVYKYFITAYKGLADWRQVCSSTDQKGSSTSQAGQSASCQTDHCSTLTSQRDGEFCFKAIHLTKSINDVYKSAQSFEYATSTGPEILIAHVYYEFF